MSESEDEEERIKSALNAQFSRLLAIECERRDSQRKAAAVFAKIKEVVSPAELTFTALAKVDDRLLAQYARAIIRQQNACSQRDDCDQRIGELIDEYVKASQSNGGETGAPTLRIVINNSEQPDR